MNNELHGDEHLTWEDEPIHLEKWEIDEALADHLGDERWLKEREAWT